MTQISDFDSIRPFNDSEVSEVIDKLCSEQYFLRILTYLFPARPVSETVASMKQIRTIDDFQTKFILPFLDELISTTTEGLTASGLENVDSQHSYLFMSNHRDIILDSALINVKLHERGVETTEIAIGDNLLIYDWITDLVKLNKSFVVRRNLPVRQQLEASETLSTFIRDSIVNRHQNIWIAQREGRSKNGDDQTQGSVIKMLNLSGSSHNVIDNIRELNIVPVSISYEYDPCDYLKAHQALLKRDNPGYQKSQSEDLNHMSTGLRGRKGRVHLSFGTPISLDDSIEQLGKNAQITMVADAIDEQIHSHYKLWPCNYIAYDAVCGSARFADRYTPADRDEFMAYVHEHISRIDSLTDEDFVLRNILEMYANPVANKMKTV